MSGASNLQYRELVFLLGGVAVGAILSRAADRVAEIIAQSKTKAAPEHSSLNKDASDDVEQDELATFRKRSDFLVQYLSNYSTHKRQYSEKELMEKLRTARTKATTIYPYLCIRRFAFAWPRLSMTPVYPLLKNKGVKNFDVDFKDLRVMDIGTCIGQDLRKMIVDGVRKENVLGVDLQAGFFDVGFGLFEDQESMQNHFAQADVFDPEFKQRPRVKEFYDFTHGGPDLISLCAVIHLFNQDKQVELIRSVTKLFDPKRGGLLVGTTSGAGTEMPFSIQADSRYMHTDWSLQRLFQEHGYTDITVISVDSGSDWNMQGGRDGFFADTRKRASLTFMARLPPKSS